MSIALALKVAPDVYKSNIDRLDVQLNRLNQIKDQYQSLINQMNQTIFNSDSSEDDVQNALALRNRAQQEIKALDTNIATAQASRNTISRTLETMQQNGTLVHNIIDDATETVANVVDIAHDAAKAAVVASEVAAIL